MHEKPLWPHGLCLHGALSTGTVFTPWPGPAGALLPQSDRWATWALPLCPLPSGSHPQGQGGSRRQDEQVLEALHRRWGWLPRVEHQLQEVGEWRGGGGGATAHTGLGRRGQRCRSYRGPCPRAQAPPRLQDHFEEALQRPQVSGRWAEARDAWGEAEPSAKSHEGRVGALLCHQLLHSTDIYGALTMCWAGPMWSGAK